MGTAASQDVSNSAPIILHQQHAQTMNDFVQTTFVTSAPLPLTNDQSLSSHFEGPSASTLAVPLSTSPKLHSPSIANPLKRIEKSTSVARSISADGFKWRKYGQKNVKESKFPRSYYRCTFPGCEVKKSIEDVEEDGKRMERVTYRGGDHIHDPSRVSKVRLGQAIFRSDDSEDETKSSTMKNDEELKSRGKRNRESTPRRSRRSAANTASDPPPQSSPRLVVETTDLDHLNDGYYWRKYGQKKVKTSDNPRSYYRCTEPDCPVKKQVEKRGLTFVTTYEGSHTHDPPDLTARKRKRPRAISASGADHKIPEGVKRKRRDSKCTKLIKDQLREQMSEALEPLVELPGKLAEASSLQLDHQINDEPLTEQVDKDFSVDEDFSTSSASSTSPSPLPTEVSSTLDRQEQS